MFSGRSKTGQKIKIKYFFLSLNAKYNIEINATQIYKIYKRYLQLKLTFYENVNLV